MTALKGHPSPSGLPFEAVRTYVLNPKAVTLGQLYGEYDLLTREWSDGILSTLVRQGAAATDADRRWYVLDGPVDAVWIENMNTVLDDNKKLCLSSGEIIALRDTQTMMFEVADLAVASPATVSRCGMVYLQPNMLGLRPLVECWLRRLPPLAQEHGELTMSLVERYLLPGLQFLRSHVVEPVASVDSCLVAAFQRLVDAFLLPLKHPGGRQPPPHDYLALVPVLLPCWVVFSLVWSVGATCDAQSRVRFSEWLRTRMEESAEALLFPGPGVVYDYRLDDGGFSVASPDTQPGQPSWVHWMDNVQEYLITPDMSFSDIEVPTIDTIRNSSLLGMLLEGGHPVLCVGDTGTCKTMTVTSQLTRGMDKSFMCEFLTFSARTTANQTQDMIESKLDRRRRGVLGPPLMRKMVFFIDDFNMPALEVFGAQPTIELIRQWMDFHGWYDRKFVGEFTTLVDVGCVAAMGPPGGGRNPVTARLLRHFHHLAFPELAEDSKVRIFGTILHHWSAKNAVLLPLEGAVVRATLDVYDAIRRELLPTPAKTHYTFNLRDLAKVFQGVLMAVPESILDTEHAIRLWYHECCRVFQDRLVDAADRGWFDSLLRASVASVFREDPTRVLGDRTILFGAFLEPLRDVKLYEEISDLDKLSRVLEQYLEDYNYGSRAPMRLVLFLDAMNHVCRIARIIRQPMGNALLLGLGGSGRRSLTLLASHVTELPCERLELTRTYGPAEWREDLKKLMLSAGLRNREAVFLFSDTQIKSETFLEDLNNVLNSGDVPNIYPVEDLEQIYQAMRVPISERGLAPTKPNLFAAFQRLVRANLHVAITMSPIGEAFRARLRQFPALVNCCTIDWFSSWPDAALRSVALRFLSEMPDLEVDEVVLNGIVSTCQFMHQSVMEASELYLQELLRHVYVTPTSYLQLLESYGSILNKKMTFLRVQEERLSSGQERLLETEKSVSAMQDNLNELVPLLDAAVKETDDQYQRIQDEKAEVELLRQTMLREETEAEAQAEKTAAMAADAQRDLDAATPAMNEAIASVRSLNKNDIAEVRVMLRPPEGVRLVLEAVCILKGIPPLKVLDHRVRGYVEDYWEPSKQMLVAPDFLRTLEHFDKNRIPADVIQKLGPYIANPEFRPEKVVKSSKACMSLCKWVHAIYKYHHVMQDVIPKRAALEKAREQLSKMMQLLEESRRRLNEVMERLSTLEAELASSLARKAALEKETQVVYDRLSRALRLLAGLDHERRQWREEILGLQENLKNITGDVLVTAGAVAYLGPFVDMYRLRLMDDWRSMLARVGVPHCPDCCPESTMGDPIETRRWLLSGLPRDRASTESAILVSLSARWPLFIDPQRQAGRWIKNLEKHAGLVVARLTDKDLLRTLESAVWFGKPYLIEDVDEELDPSLDPVLLRQVFVQGGTRLIAIGDNLVPYNDSFRLYITTKLPNPHFNPEVSIKVMIVNFALVPSGLQDQMLSLVVAMERPDLEAIRSSLIVSRHEMSEELKLLGDRILHRISTTEGQLVDDVELILMLEATKVKTEEIQAKVEEAQKTQVVIDATRALYIPVATRSQILFFCVSDLAAIDPMYQYSLEWFVDIFVASMQAAEVTANTDERVASINAVLTFDLFSNVCRSLFERHKQHFAFLLAVRILVEEGVIDSEEYRVFLSAGTAPAEGREKPPLDWLTDRAWYEILSLEVLPAFQEFVSHFIKEGEKFKNVFDSMEPHREPLPHPWEEAFSDFQHMMVVKCVRPDKVVNAMQDYIVRHLGQRFVEPQTTNLDSLFKDSCPTTPLVFVLSAGTDPAEDFYKFAEQMRFNKRLKSISLGQGQGEKAEFLFASAVENGNWVYFQNCHLSPSWMPQLQMLVENLVPEDTHRDFRLWLTSMPSPHFPVTILQNSAKMTVEPPRGIQANMLRAYANHVPDFKTFLESADPKVPTFRLLQFALCLFHSVCLERRKFGPLGFNIPYEFTDGDLRICLSQLKMFLLEYDEVPFKVLQYTAGEINYGGRVTDDWDRRCIKNLLDDFYEPRVLDENYSFDEDGIYHQLPVETSLAEYVTYIRTLPLNDTPAIFGLHENADISYAQAETFSCLATLSLLQPRVVGSDAAVDQDEVIVRETTSIDRAVPQLFDIPAVVARYPVLYEESLNTVLVQEAIRYNRLLDMIHDSISKMLSALKGLVVMSEDLENMSYSIFNNSVPRMWETLAYPSLKPLGAWVKDLQERVQFVQKWIDEGIPPVFWISGFYFPQAFLTATLQNYARKHVISIDTIKFSFQILDEFPTEKPEDGCCIYGLYLEGCRWSASQHILAESRLKELYTDMAVVWLVPEQHYRRPSTGMYECPVYKTLTRAGVLSTTGHSTNYVLTVEIPSDQPQKHWIKRGVALICALDY